MLAHVQASSQHWPIDYLPTYVFKVPGPKPPPFRPLSHTENLSPVLVLPVLAVSTNIIVTRICVLSSSIDSHKVKKNVYMIPQVLPLPVPHGLILLQAHTTCCFWLLGLHARHRLSFGLASTVLE